MNNGVNLPIETVLGFLVSCMVGLIGYIVKQHDNKLKAYDDKFESLGKDLADLHKGQADSKEEILKAIYDTRLFAANNYCTKSDCPVLKK